MKVIAKAKRRWFTQHRQARIVWNTRWGALSNGFADALMSSSPAHALAKAVRDHAQSVLMEAFREKVLRPMIKEVLEGVGGPKPAGLLSYSGTGVGQISGRGWSQNWRTRRQ